MAWRRWEVVAENGFELGVNSEPRGSPSFGSRARIMRNGVSRTPAIGRLMKSGSSRSVNFRNGEMAWFEVSQRVMTEPMNSCQQRGWRNCRSFPHASRGADRPRRSRESI